MPDLNMSISTDNRRRFRGIGHSLAPIVTVAGNGLHEALLHETERALKDHELIKVRLSVDDRGMRQQMANTLCEQLRAELVQQIGKLILIYRHNPKADPRLSNLQRHAAKR
jgi:RNA-binding protein